MKRDPDPDPDLVIRTSLVCLPPSLSGAPEGGTPDAVRGAMNGDHELQSPRLTKKFDCPGLVATDQEILPRIVLASRQTETPYYLCLRGYLGAKSDRRRYV